MATQKFVRTAIQLGFASAMLAAALCASANAAAPGDVAAVTVKYGDLDLSTEVGVHRLYRRIVAAAERVCPGDSTPELQVILIARACRADAIERAVRAVNNQQLALVHEQSTRHS